MTTRDDRSRLDRPTATVLAVPDATRKGNQAYDLMRREIVACRLLPGTRFTEAEVMEARERTLLAGLGIDDPYRAILDREP